jgi:hypothetical protein
MCFSASASFGAGVVLLVIGVASISKAKSPSQIVFASIPFIFAVQQITEGFLWLALSSPAFVQLRQVTTYNFLFFAQVVWPFWVPLAIYKLEKKETEKKTLLIFVLLGAVVSLYLSYCLLMFPIEAKIISYHISYIQGYPASLKYFVGILYIIATIVPPFFSSIKRMWMLGMTVLFSYIISTIFYTDYIISVWCFFASIISFSIYAIMYNINKPINKVDTSIKADLQFS